MAEEFVFLVEVKVFLLGGGEVNSFDVVKAVDGDAARNTAFNYYILGGEHNAVNFGRKLFLPGTIAAVHVAVLAVLDPDHPFNEQWKTSLEVSEQWGKQLERMLTDRVNKIDGR